MKLLNLAPLLLVAAINAPGFAADKIDNLKIGDADVFFDFQQTETGVSILTLIAQVSETNNSLRGLKNSDNRRLSKLGQLVFQCKLMLRKTTKNDSDGSAGKPFLISRNYSLYTGVDLDLATNERLGIQAQALKSVDDASLFTPSLGKGDAHRGMWETVGEDASINLKQFNINVLNETDLIETSESIDISVRFPVFQLEKPVRQWHYNFNLKDFRRAIRYVDDNCTPVRLEQLID